MDVLPLPRRPTSQHGVLDAHVGDGLGEPGDVGAIGGDRREELVVLDADQVLEADPVGRAGHEVAVVREAVAAVHVRESGVRVVAGDVHLQLVHLLEVPADRTLRAVDLEEVLTLRTDHRPARLERSTGTALEDAHRTDVVLVGDLTGRIARASAVVMRAGPGGQGPLFDEDLSGPDDAADRPAGGADQEVGEVDGVAEDVGRHSVARLIDEEPPRQQAERIRPVHREEPAVVVRDVADRTTVDELLGVLDERRPAIVVADPGDHARPPRRELGGDGLGRCSADRLLAEHVLAVGRRRFDHLDVEHVRSRHEHDVDVVVFDHAAPERDRRFEPERSHGLLAPVLDGVADDHQLGLVVAVGEVARSPAATTAVRLTHPSEADHTDPDTLRRNHGVTTPAWLVIGTRGSVAMSVHESRTQWWVGSSQNAIDRTPTGPASTLR